MNKKNQTKGIFTELIGNERKRNSFEIFLSAGETIPPRSVRINKRAEINDILIESKNKYLQLIKNNKKLFKKLASLETTIMQVRCILATEVKLTMINQKRGGSETSYVVARAPFFNPNNVKAEIRVYLGKTEEIGNDLEMLSMDSKFRK